MPLHARRGGLSISCAGRLGVRLRGREQRGKLIHGLPVRPWNEVALDVDGHFDRRVAELVADIGRALAGHQEN